MTNLEDAVAPSDPLPRWDLTPLFPSVDGAELRRAEQQLVASLADLRALYDHHDVRGGRSLGDDEPPAQTDAFDEVLVATNQLYDDFEVLETFAYAHVSSDSANESAQQLLSRLQALEAQTKALRTRFDSWVARLGADNLIGASPLAREHAWPLRKAEERAQHQMSEAEETLAAELAVTGSTAWSRLYDDVSAGISTSVRFPDGTVKTLPIFAVRGLATNPDPALRKAAFDAELEAWEAHATPIAAAINAVKGEGLSLASRRGWDDPLEPALMANAVDRPTLAAMNAAVDDALGDFHRYLLAKAQLLGKKQCAFWDLFAPVGSTRPQQWADCVAMVEQAFAGYSPDLLTLARRALAESWVDAGPRTGKVGGGFCTPAGQGTSRILMNFDGSIDAVHTLAHELGHAYHNHTLRNRTPLQRATPMPLAETASIFCETIFTEVSLAEADDDQQRLALLEVDLQGACQVVVDIRSRFLFETRLFERRRSSTVSPRELCELMDAAQAEAYGDALDAAARHRYMWAAKPHYYFTSFYNWPYTFGLLFGLGLYARWREDPDGFRGQYDELLSSTGLDRAVDLAARFGHEGEAGGTGFDLHDRAFWDASLDVLRSRIDQFTTLATTP